MYLDDLLLDERGLLKILPADTILGSLRSFDDLRLWCHQRAVYGVPTLELVEWLRREIGGRRAIEIGCGNGALGRALGITLTDSCLQQDPAIKAWYLRNGQPVVQYPDDVQKWSGLEAVSRFKPRVVVACWVTQIYRASEHWRGGNMFGVEEDKILDRCDYVHVGNLGPHHTKRILDRPHETYRFEWLVSRAERQSDNVIWVWRK